MFKVVKRQYSKRRFIYVQVMSIVVAMLIASIFILLTKNNPIEVYEAMIKGAFGSSYRIKETIIKSIPLTVTSLGIIIAFKMKFWNIGAEGQIMMGAFMGSYIALNFSGLPKPLLLTLMFIASFICGGFWGFIPAFFKAKFKTNETIFTLLMNYIALKWITFLQYGPWKDPSALGFAKIPSFKDSAVLPKLFGIHSGWLIALILVILIFILNNYTKFGYEVSVVGESENTAVYAGMNVEKIILKTIFISAGICGLTGFIQASAVNKTLSVTLSGGIGYTAIITAWLSNLNAFMAMIVSILFAAMNQGASFIQMAFNIPEAVADILQGIILFCILGNTFFVNYKIVRNR